MAEVLLLNPRRRRRKNPRHRHRRHHHRASNPHRKRRRRSYAVMANPRRRRRRNPFLINSRRRRRRNPSLRGIGTSVMPTIKGGFTGAIGALGLDVIVGAGAQFLPAQLQTGYPLVAMKLLGAVLVGMIGGKLPGLRGHGRDLAIGGATVAIHDALKPIVQSALPSLPMAGYFSAGSYAGGAPVATPMITTGMGRLGMYQGRMAGLGKYVSLSGLSQQTEEIGEYNSGIFD